MHSALFQPLQVKDLKLRNRIVVAPMCQYSAENGCMTDWHLIHLGHLALSGAALLTIEATAVTPEGRITYADVGLYDDATEAAIRRTVESIRRWSDIPIAIQLAHAGRKASTEVPWKGGAQLLPDQITSKGARGWQTVSASAIPFQENENPPIALDRDGMRRVRDALPRPPGVRHESALTWCRSTGRMDICCISFFRRFPINAKTNMVGRSKIACGFRWRSSMRCARRFRRTSLSRCASRGPIG